MKKLNILFGLLISTTGHAHEAGETSAQIGPGKAVEAVNEEMGLKLSPKAIDRLKIKTSPVTTDDPMTLPKSSFVAGRGTVGIYRLRSGWFKFISVSTEIPRGGSAVVQSKEIKSGDQIVVSGVGLLRVADINVHGDEETEDSHDDEVEGGSGHKDHDEHKDNSGEGGHEDHDEAHK